MAVGNHLRERGIRVVFVIEESFEGELEKRGFEEALMRMAAPPGTRSRSARAGRSSSA